MGKPLREVVSPALAVGDLARVRNLSLDRLLARLFGPRPPPALGGRGAARGLEGRRGPASEGASERARERAVDRPVAAP